MRASHGKVWTLVIMAAALTISGCGMATSQKGAMIGAAAGAAAGAAVGNANGSAARGAIIGAAVGATAGAVIGRAMTQQVEELEAALPEAKVERVSEESVKVTFAAGVFFGFDRADLTAEARRSLDVLVTTLEKHPGMDVAIIGHTDGMGTDAYNLRLSDRRAAAAGSYLISRGINPRRVTTIGMGKSEPVASNATEEGRALNRRVEVVITPSESYRKELEHRGH
jgi:outer membrane protein OmpA-like peptidoglycan-associated protein